MLRWHQNAFFGGISSDRFVGIPQAFQTGNNIDVRSEPRVIKLAHKSTNTTPSVIADWVMCFVTIQSSGDVIAFGDAGKIYRQTHGTGDWVLVYTDTLNRKITDAHEFNDYLYWTTNDKLHRISVGSISTVPWGVAVTENYQSFLNGHASLHPMFEANNTLYIGDTGYVATLDSLGTWTNNKLALYEYEAPVGITYDGQWLKIYTQKSTSVDYGRLYLWNGATHVWNQMVPLGGKTPHAVFTKLNIDYFVAGRKPALYNCNGFQFQPPLKLIPGATDGSSQTMNHNGMAVIDDLVLMGISDTASSTISKGIWSWGAKDKDYPQVLSFDNYTSNADPADQIGAITVSNNQIYMAWKNGSTYGVDIIDQTKFQASGSLTSLAWDGSDGKQKKEFVYGGMSFFPLNAGEQIDLYVRRDMSSSWGTPVITVAYGDGDTTPYREIPGVTMGDPFNFLETKVALTAGTGGATTPRVLDIDIYSQPVGAFINE